MNRNDSVDGITELRKNQLLDEWYAQLSKNGNNTYRIGDLVLAKWQDEQYYLAKILEIEIKTKFGTKAKHYKVKYLYDNIRDIILESRLKPASLQDIEALNALLDEDDMNLKRGIRKSSVLKRKAPFNILSEESSNDNVFYDEKTKNFTESCRLRRQRLSIETENAEANPASNNVLDISAEQKEIKKQVVHKKRRTNNVYPAESRSAEPRHSSRKRKCCLRNSDYFYPESFDQIFNDKVNDESALKVPAELNVSVNSMEALTKIDDKASVGQENENIVPSNTPLSHANNNHKENEALSINSPEIASFASDLTPTKKTTADSVEDIEEHPPQGAPINDLYSATGDGQFHCNSCHNKSFRKKRLVLDHIKHYHQTQQLLTTPTITNNITNNTTVTDISENEDNNSSNTKLNSTTAQKPQSTITQSQKTVPRVVVNKIKKYIPNSSYSSRLNRSLYSEPYKRKSFKSSWKDGSSCSSMLSSNTKKKHTASTKKQQQHQQNNHHRDRFQPSPCHIVYCNRCKKCTEEPYSDMVQCSVCLCWSHRSCYELPPQTEEESFWACDNCLGHTSPAPHAFPHSSTHPSSSSHVSSSSRRQEVYCRDKWRFGGVSSVSAGPAPNQNYRNLCEVETVLSVCNRVLDSIMRNIEKLHFTHSFKPATHNDSNSQDDLEILKSFSIDQVHMHKLDHLLDHLPESSDDIFKDTAAMLPSNSTLPSACKPTSCLQPTHSTATPSDIDHALTGVTNHDLYLQFSAEIPHLSNSTPNKLLHHLYNQSSNSAQTSAATTTANNTKTLLNNSLDNLLSECDVNLDFLPNSEFDALVKDLRNCEEIVNKTPKHTLNGGSINNHKSTPAISTAPTTITATTNNHKTVLNSSHDEEDIHVSRSSNLLLDLFEEVEADEKKRNNTSGSMSVSAISLPLTTCATNINNNSNLSITYTNPVSQHKSTVITNCTNLTPNNKHTRIANENEILDFLIEKEESNCVNLVPGFLQENSKPEFKEDKSNTDSHMPSPLKFEPSLSSCLSNNHNHMTFSSSQPSCVIKQNINTSLTNNNLITSPHKSTSLPFATCSTTAATINMNCLASPPLPPSYSTDNKLLNWLITKYESVEKIVDSVTKIVNISNPTRNHNDYKRIRHYLSSLLFVLQRNND